MSKFKIVGFAPASSAPAATAKLVCTFSDEVNLTSDDELWFRFGGDGKAVVHIAPLSTVSTAEDLAALFTGTSFTKDGKTYTASVSEDTVTFTASVEGEVDTIPEIVEVFTDELLAEPAVDVEAPTAEFTNGKNAKSAADSFIDQIKQFQSEVDNDWYYLLTDKDDDDYVIALAKFAEASEPSEAELGAGVEDHRKFYMGQTSNKAFVCNTARAAVIYADADHLNEEPDASYTGNVGPFYPTSVTWKFKRPQDGNATTTKLITLPILTDGERDALLENHVNFLTEEYKRQYVKDGTCLNGEFIDVVLGGDWIAKRMRDLLYDILLANANINYGDDGFGLIGTAVVQALAEATDLNIIARDPESKTGVFTVVIPKYAESTEDQRRNRVMPDITWEAQLAGAVHQVKTKGVLRATL